MNTTDQNTDSMIRDRLVVLGYAEERSHWETHHDIDLVVMVDKEDGVWRMGEYDINEHGEPILRGDMLEMPPSDMLARLERTA